MPPPEAQPDPDEPSGGTPDDRAHAERLEGHSEETTAPTDQESTSSDPD